MLLQEALARRRAKRDAYYPASVRELSSRGCARFVTQGGACRLGDGRYDINRSGYDITRGPTDIIRSAYDYQTRID